MATHDSKVKSLWTLKSAAAFFHLSIRQLLRYVQEQTDFTPAQIGTRLVYLFGPAQMDRLKAILESKKGPKQQKRRPQHRTAYQRFTSKHYV